MLDIEELRQIGFSDTREKPPIDLLKHVANQMRRDIVTMLAEAGYVVNLP